MPPRRHAPLIFHSVSAISRTLNLYLATYCVESFLVYFSISFASSLF